MLPERTALGEVGEDYRAVGLSLKSHPMAFIRETLATEGVTENARLANPACTPAGDRITVSGIVLVRQRPGTASGIVFFTIEDETGIANLIVRPQVYERYRAVARHSRVIAATGVVERQGEVVHVMVRRIRGVNIAEGAVHATSRDFH
jgi:error-prone DNA polymerase